MLSTRLRCDEEKLTKENRYFLDFCDSWHFLAHRVVIARERDTLRTERNATQAHVKID